MENKGLGALESLMANYYEMRCPYCGCHFSFEEEDIDRNVAVGTYKHRGTTCPHCKNDVQVRDYSTHYLMPNVKVRFEK